MHCQSNKAEAPGGVLGYKLQCLLPPLTEEVESKAKRGRTRVCLATQERMELDTAVFSSAGKRRRSTEEEPGDENQTTKDNKKAKAQIGEAQEEIRGEVNESEVCEREKGERARNVTAWNMMT
jgi:hypothetical protein